MRRMQIIKALVPAILLSPGWLLADTSLPQPVKTSQREFSIPYDLDDWDTAGEKPAAVQLHLSEDHGVNWRVYSKAPPTSGAFDFRAPQLGEYWFAVRTIGAGGKLWPDGDLKAGATRGCRAAACGAGSEGRLSGQPHAAGNSGANGQFALVRTGLRRAGARRSRHHRRSSCGGPATAGSPGTCSAWTTTMPAPCWSRSTAKGCMASGW